MRSMMQVACCSFPLLLSSCGNPRSATEADQVRRATPAGQAGHGDSAAHGVAHAGDGPAGHDVEGDRHRLHDGDAPRGDAHTSRHGDAPHGDAHAAPHHANAHHGDAQASPRHGNAAHGDGQASPDGGRHGQHSANHDGGQQPDGDAQPVHGHRGGGKHAAADDERHGGASDHRGGAEPQPAPAAGGDSGDTAEALSGLSATEIFNRRILPILRSDKASSCTECHFGGVELKNYIREDQAAMFAALRAENLIDVEAPEKSKLLTFISRRPEREDQLLAKVRQSEYEAFRAWIRAAARDPGLLAAEGGETTLGTELPVEVVRHMRRDRVLRSFVDNIWSEIGRCINCHSPERNQRVVRKHGEQVSWIVPRDPAGTLEKLVEAGDIDTDDPEASLVVLKPLGLEEHGGGPKFAVGSRTDKNFRRFLRDYAAVVNGKYERVDQLPQPSQDVAVMTDQQLRIVELPAGLDKKLLRAEIHRWTDRGWSETPWGIAESAVNGERRLWQNIVLLVAPRGSKRADELQRAGQPRLPGGRYLVKIYIDREDKTKRDRDHELGPDDFFGQVEFRGPWPPGYQPPKIIHAPDGGLP